MIKFLFTILFSILFVPAVSSHELSKSLLNIDAQDPARIVGDLRLDSHDIQKVITIDHDQNGILTWEEIVSRPDETIVYLKKHLSISWQNKQCTLSFQKNWELTSHFDADYVLIPLALSCPNEGKHSGRTIRVEFTGLFEVDPGHSLIVELQLDNEKLQGIVSAHKQVITIDTAKRLERLTSFMYQGALHVAIGYDHLMFVFCLLIALVFPAPKNRWLIQDDSGHQNSKKLLIKTVGVITTFSIAHSLTLAFSALGWISMSGAWVELIIAASVLMAAINIIFRFHKFLYSIVFIFGLLHGLGYANALTSLEMTLSDQLLSILAFNIGVELAQVSIVCLLMPILLIVKRSDIAAHYCVIISAGLAISLALFWLVTRIPAVMT